MSKPGFGLADRSDKCQKHGVGILMRFTGCRQVREAEVCDDSNNRNLIYCNYHINKVRPMIGIRRDFEEMTKKMS